MSIEIRGDAFFGTIDEFRDVDEPTGSTRISRGGFLYLRGWILGGNPPKPAEALSFRVGESPWSQATLGFERIDLAQAFGESALGGGFCAAVPIDAPIGTASMSVLAQIDRQQTSTEVANVVPIESPPNDLAGLTWRPEHWEYAVDGIFVEGDQAVEIDADGVFIVPPQRPARLRMWIVDAAGRRRAPQAVIARVGGRFLPVTSGIVREDVVAVLKAPYALRSGVSLSVMPGPMGVEEIGIYAVADDGSYTHVVALRVRQPNTLSSSLLPATARIMSALDDFYVEDRPVDPRGSIRAAVDARIRLRGWAFDELGPRLVGGIELRIDDILVTTVQSTTPRVDVASQFGEQVVETQFMLEFRVPILRPGSHSMVLRALSARRDATCELLCTALIVLP